MAFDKDQYTGYKGIDTEIIRDQIARTPFRKHAQPLYLISSYIFDSAEQAQDTFDGTLQGLPSHPQAETAAGQMKRGGGLVSFELPGGSAQAMQFLNRLQMISLTSNLGDSRTIATHPATTTHAKLSEEERAAVGVTPGLVRLSLGLEAAEDIIGDIEQASGSFSLL